MEKIRAVIFDLDGTLGNTLPLCVKAFRRSIESYTDREISDDEIISTFGPSEEGTIMALIPDYYEEGVARYLTSYEILHDICPQPFDGIIDLLDSLKDRKVRLAMVTGKGKYSTEITLQKFNIADFFEKIETGHPNGPRKTEGIKSVLDCFIDIRKEEIIYVGDAPNDIIASKQAGISVASAAWADTAEPKKLIELNPDQIFYTIEDFRCWLDEKI